ncbi:MAG: mannose-6-phosphate isomerase, class I [Corynebacterium sp.]|nr:mannose-6-phosphate isomerase, class I [Corynebacterium sp.]
MQKIKGAARAYSWGSKSLIPQLQGKPEATHPIAELWYGAHPGLPSPLETPQGSAQNLHDLIADNPDAELGAKVSTSFAARLPFLLKILAAAEPLSLQAHPSKSQAEEGFARENTAGLPIDAPERSYKDDNHKPELIVALTDFYAMAGFRPLAETRVLVSALGSQELMRSFDMLVPSGELDERAESDSMRALFTTWISFPAPMRKKLIGDVIESARSYLHESHSESPEWIAGVLRTVVSLDEQYPGDIGVLGALLLNHIHLAPGEALYLDAGQLHAYVRGLGVEIMANSDNVLRGGLTPKFVNVSELVKVLTFAAEEDPRVSPTRLNAESRGIENALQTKVYSYPVPINEFALNVCEMEPSGSVTVNPEGPAIVLVTQGELTLTDAYGGESTIGPTEAVWISNAEEAVELAAGAGAAQVFIASVGS